MLRPLVAVALAVLAPAAAPAAFTLTLREAGPDLVLSGSGTLNLSGLTLIDQPTFTQPGVNPLIPFAVAGQPGGLATDYYTGLTGPTNFGPGGPGQSASSGTGGPVGFFRAGGTLRLVVPDGYVSNTPLTATSLLTNQTLAGLGATPGTYRYTWAADTLTLVVGGASPPPAVPAPGTLGLLLSAAPVLAGVWRRRLGGRPA